MEILHNNNVTNGGTNNRTMTKQSRLPPPSSSSLSSSTPNQSSSLHRKSYIKISTEQIDKNGICNGRSRNIPIIRSISHNVNVNDNNKKNLQNLQDESLIYQSSVNNSRINLRISSSDPIILRMLSRVNSLNNNNNNQQQQQFNSSLSSNERCFSPTLSSSGYESFNSSTINNNSNNNICRSSSTNRLLTEMKLQSNYHQNQKQNQNKSTPSLPTIKQQRQRLSKYESSSSSTATTETKSMKDDIINSLDRIEKRIQFLREISYELLDEKNKLLDALNKISITTTSQSQSPSPSQLSPFTTSTSFSEVDIQDINATVNNLLQRLQSVNIIINKPTRTVNQIDSFEKVKKYLDQLNQLILMNNNNDGGCGKMNAKKKCLTLLYSCTSDYDSNNNNNVDFPIDERFQKIVIDCSIEDQKMIRKILKNFLEQIDKK